MPRIALPLALIAVALGLAACSGGGEPTATQDTGAAVFTDAGCGDCHALSAAGLERDGRPQPRRSEAQRRARRAAGREWGGAVRPAFGGRLTDEEIDAVSAYVAQSAATSKVSVAAKFEPDDTTLADCKADSACFEQAFGNLAFTEEGPSGRWRSSPRRSRPTPPFASAIGSRMRSAPAGWRTSTGK